MLRRTGRMLKAVEGLAMLSKTTITMLRQRGFTAGEISRIAALAEEAHSRPECADARRRRLDTEAVLHAAAGGDPLAAKLAPVVGRHGHGLADSALLDATVALGERLRVHMV